MTGHLLRAAAANPELAIMVVIGLAVWLVAVVMFLRGLDQPPPCEECGRPGCQLDCLVERGE